MFIAPFLLVIVGLFLTIKFVFLGVRFSDTNVYFMTGYSLLHGSLLYKDIFFTNLPLFPYISAFYVFLTGGKLNWYYLTSSLEALGVASIIFFILLKQTKQQLLALLGSSIYLFSFIVLATSDHQTGVFLASLISITGYLFFTHKRFFLAGFFIALALTAKLYFLPVVVGIAAYMFLYERKNSLSVFLGILAGITGVIVPIFILSGPTMIENVFFYSFFRGAGLEKLPIFYFFITHDPLLSVLLIFNLYQLRNKTPLSLITLFSLAFIFIYQDIYYLYLNLLVPYIVLAVGDFIIFLRSKLVGRAMYVVGIVFFVICIWNVGLYLHDFATLQKIPMFEEMVSAIKGQKPERLYGAMELVPALSYSTQVPLLEGIIDTNENIFRKGIYNAKDLTKKALQKRTILISKGMIYPQLKINEPLATEIFDKELVNKNCKIFYSAPLQAEGAINTIVFFRCY